MLNNVVFGPELDKRFEVRHPQNLSIGYKTVINGDCFINALGKVTIGKFCHIAKGLTIYSHNHNWKSEEYILILKSATIIQYTIKGRFMSR